LLIGVLPHSSSVRHWATNSSHSNVDNMHSVGIVFSKGATSDVSRRAANSTMVTSQVLRQTVPEVSHAFSLMEFYRSPLQKVYFILIATASCEMKTRCFPEYLTF